MKKDEFKNELLKLKIQITDNEINKFEKYKNLLQTYNKKFNLTAIVDDDNIYLKHFYDSLYIMTIEEFKTSKKVLDIGTGAGFPGLALAILNNDKFFTLVESNSKKCAFLNVVKEELKLKNVTIYNQRAEDFIKNHKEEYDVATSRAVSHLKILSELEIPALKINGYFLPLKSSVIEEINQSLDLIKRLNSKIVNTVEYFLPIENSKRTIIIIKKENKTDEKYPRNYSKIIKDLKKI